MTKDYSIQTYIIMTLVVGVIIGFYIGGFMTNTSEPLNREYRDEFEHMLEHEAESSHNESEVKSHDEIEHDENIPHVHNSGIITTTDPLHDNTDHDHIPIETELALDVQLNITSDGNSTYILHTMTNLVFAPNSVNKEHIDGEGHAHYYINGMKKGRIYAPYVQLSGIQKGDDVTVTLSSNNHMDYTYTGEVIQASITAN